ncbi:MAG: hypothetical protein ACTSYB_14260 [Candidatus Helarchaeota archaeon]
MAFNFDEFFQRFLKLFKQIIEDPNSNHPLKQYFSEEDLKRLTENPPKMDDISKIMQHLFGDPNFNPFSAINSFHTTTPSPTSSKDTNPQPKSAQKPSTDINLVTDIFEFGNEVHVIVGTNRTDLEFKTGVKKGNPNDLALIIRDKYGTPLKIVKLPSGIDRTSKRVTYQNGTYEIIYQKNS